MTGYLVYDVFTDTAFGGNPLAVIPDATDLGESHLLPIAREFGFSETTFVYPPVDPANTWRVRIFTPMRELDFAGHPTVGTALALYDSGMADASMTLELNVGPLPVTVADGVAEFTTRVPLATRPAPTAAALAPAIGHGVDAIRTDRHAPIVAGLGNDFVIMELTDLSHLQAVAADTDAFLNATGPEGASLGLLVYIRDGAAIRARMVEPWGGIPEDPATGSAAAALAALLGQVEGRSNTFDIQQGIEMGRPSRITAKVEVADGAPVAVAISGRAVKTMEGRLTL